MHPKMLTVVTELKEFSAAISFFFPCLCEQCRELVQPGVQIVWA